MPSLNFIRFIHAKYGKKLVFSPLDKNPACILICCQRVLEKDLKTEFLDDKKHYKQINLSTDEFYNQVKILHDSLPNISKHRWGLTKRENMTSNND